MNRGYSDPTAEICHRARNTHLLILDVDGVLTDGSIVYTDAGEEIKTFHVRDGHGIRMVLESGIEVVLITGRNSRAVAFRAQNLKISRVFQGVRNKLEVLHAVQQELHITHAETAVVGDDLVDLPIMLQAGFAVAVADAPREVQERAHLVTTAPGGKGAVREVCEIILKSKGLWDGLLRRFCDK